MRIKLVTINPKQMSAMLLQVCTSALETSA